MNKNSMKGKIEGVCVSKEKGTIKEPVESILLDEQGIKGDAHRGPWHRQLSLLSAESVDRFAKESGYKASLGEFAENILVKGFDFRRVQLLDRFTFGDGELEVTQIGKECHGDNCAVFRAVGKCVMPKEGIFCRVLEGGTLAAGDEIVYYPRTLNIQVITMSDRAFSGEYDDLSGPLAEKMLKAFALSTHWQLELSYLLLPDEESRLHDALSDAIDEAMDVVFVLGGTGVGPRDITPEVVNALCHKTLPGIMEHIRLKYGAQNPKALLSRSVAGIAENTQIYALPGSVKAVNEYMAEILKTLEHVVYMMNEIDNHG